MKLNHFLNGLGLKYLPAELRPTFSTTTHFIERLLVDRADNLNTLWVSTVFTRLYRDRLCEFLYLLETAPDRGRINIQLSGRSIALIKEDHEYGMTIKLVTCFTGVALNPTLIYSILSLDTEA
jgi:hypothetical protein